MRGLFWWVDRWRASGSYVSMTLEQQAAFRNLLDEACLRGGGIPDDPIILSRASGDAVRWPRLRKEVMKRFKLVDGEWRNQTLDEVLRESARRAANQRAYRKRHNGHG